MDNIDFGIWLKEKRIEAVYESQGLLSRACGIDHSTIARWERGFTKPSPENLKKLAPFLKTSCEELMAAAGYLDKNDRHVKTCPVLTAYLKDNTSGLMPIDQPCKQNKCRWWIGDDCAVSWAGRFTRAILMGQFKLFDKKD